MPHTALTKASLGRGGCVLALLAPLLFATPASAQTNLLRIGTGGEKGTYFLVGARIADVIADRQDICDGIDQPCGVAGLLAVPQLSNGSVANIEAMAAGVLEAALVQADIAHEAFTATGTFAGEKGAAEVRAVASLYAETVHIVVANAAGITDVAALRGRRVSLDELGSGTLVDARAVLHAHGLSEADLQPFYIKPDFAVERMSRNELDAFFIVAGHPTPSVTEALRDGAASLLGIDAQRAAALASERPYLYASEIPAGTYAGIGTTPTLAVSALLVVNASLDEALVHDITAALWSERSARLLTEGNPLGREITVENALRGVSIPLHPGAARFYREQGMEPDSSVPTDP